MELHVSVEKEWSNQDYNVFHAKFKTVKNVLQVKIKLVKDVSLTMDYPLMLNRVIDAQSDRESIKIVECVILVLILIVYLV